MKKLLILSALLHCGLLTSAQKCTPVIDNSRLIVGITEHPSAAVYDGLFNARYDVRRRAGQIVLIAGKDLISVHYEIYNTAGQLMADGELNMKAGEYELLNVGVRLDSCRFVFSPSPIACSKP